jgi:hypothetical protein
MAHTVSFSCIEDELSCTALQVAKCLAIKGAEDAINREHAFEISTHDAGNMYFIADDSRVCSTARSSRLLGIANFASCLACKHMRTSS